jgi:VWFA-related protein
MAISRRGLISALAFPAVRLLRGAQEPKFSTVVKVVNVLASVRDKNGQIVRNLAKDDFVLDEDGRPQVISYFSQETDLPLTLGLLVDTSLSVRRVISAERDASYRFLQQVVREDRDAAFIIHFDFDVELLQDLTASRTKLEKALEQLGEGDPFPYRQWGGRRRGRGGGTLLYDSVLLASDDLMKKQKERKALIVLSDGVDNGSRTGLMSAIESAQRADTLIYCILFEDPEYYAIQRSQAKNRAPMGGLDLGDGREVMRRMSEETGGRFFEVSPKMPVNKIYQAIEEELRNQYSIGYSSDQDAETGSSYRHIHLTTKKRGLTVQARQGYYAS